jgi:hypothetical protein
VTHAKKNNFLVVDDPQAPNIYVDGVIGAAPLGAPDGIVRLTFGAILWDHNTTPPMPYTKTVLRVTIPIAGLRNGIEFINRALETDPETADGLPIGMRLQ